MADRLVTPLYAEEDESERSLRPRRFEDFPGQEKIKEDLRIAVLALLLAPLAKAVFEAGAIAHGARPLNELIHRAGFWALVFLGVTLAVTPFRRVLRYGNLIDVRRMLGVGTFCYIAAHLALFFADQSYSFAKFFHEITHRVYLIIGAVAWLSLAALAATSTDGMVRRLGGVRWRRLHQLIERHADIRRRFESLTPREQDVIKLVVDGRANKVIAIDLGLSERTVEIHRANVMEKMGARSIAHLVKMHMMLTGENA